MSCAKEAEPDLKRTYKSLAAARPEVSTEDQTQQKQCRAFAATLLDDFEDADDSDNDDAVAKPHSKKAKDDATAKLQATAIDAQEAMDALSEPRDDADSASGSRPRELDEFSDVSDDDAAGDAIRNNDANDPDALTVPKSKSGPASTSLSSMLKVIVRPTTKLATKSNLIRAAKRAEARSAKANGLHEKALTATAETYNKGKLRRCDMLNPGLVGGSRTRRPQWAHRLHWTAAGVITLAFCAIGMASLVARRFMQGTRRVVDACAIVALALEWHYLSLMRNLRSSASSGARKPPWLLFIRTLDCTPIRVKFGLLQGVLAKIARYWHKEKGAKQSVLLRAAELSKVTRAMPAYGIVELMAQQIKFVYPESDRAPRIPCKPLYLASSNASCQLRAFNTAYDGFSLTSLFSMAETVPLVVLALVADSAASCTRLKTFIAAKTRHANAASVVGQFLVSGRNVFLPIECASHILFREVEHAGVKIIIGRLYDTAFCFSLSDIGSRVCGLLQEIVERDLRNGGFFPGVEPAEACDYEEHKGQFLAMTKFRFVGVRASAREDAEISSEIEFAMIEYTEMNNGERRIRTA